MSLATAELPADPDALRAFALACQGELKVDRRRRTVGCRAHRPTAARPPAAAYFYNADRTGARPAAQMANFTGLLQADGYSGFEKLYDPARRKPENGMRCIALGRKNFLFAGSDAGGDRAAAIYTIVQATKLNDVNPEAYLRNLLARIADGHPINRLDALLPWNMVRAEGAS